MGGINILYAKDNESWLSCIVKYKQTVSTLTSFFTSYQHLLSIANKC